LAWQGILRLVYRQPKAILTVLSITFGNWYLSPLLL